LAGGDVAKAVVVRPLGLLTQGSKYGVYPPGAMSIAKNVVIRDPGVLSSMPGLSGYANNIGLTAFPVRRIWPGTTHSLAAHSGLSTLTWGVLSGGGIVSVAQASGVGAYAYETGRLSVVNARGRTMLNTSKDPVVVDSEGASTSRHVGLLTPGSLSASTASLTNARSLADGYQRRYRVIARRVSADGYEIFSAPTNSIEARNVSAGATVDPNIVIDSPGSSMLRAGDVLELYRTDDQLIGTDPGDTYRLAQAYTIKTADLFGSVTMRDVSTRADLGNELYTNPGADPLTRDPNYLPGMADDIVIHEGHAFYLTRKVNESVIAKPNGQVGSLTTAEERSTGIGWRRVTGDTTNGNFDIINISDMTGLQIGQVVTATGLPVGPSAARITAIVGTTITLSVAPSVTAAGAIVDIYDVIETSASTFVQITGSFALSLNADVISTVPTIALIEAAGGISFDDASGGSFIFRRPLFSTGAASPYAVRATNGQNYSPTLPLTTETAQAGKADERYNRWHISKFNEPEHVGINSKILVGSATNYRGVSVGGVMLVFASDGLWQVSGLAGSWAIKSLDPSLILAARGCVAVMDGLAWAYTNRGLVTVSPDGSITEISNGKIGQANAGGSGEFNGHAYADTWDRYLVCDDRHREVLVTLDGGVNFFVYSARSDAFTTYVPASTGPATAAAYSSALASLMLTRDSGAAVHLEYFSPDSTATRMANAQVRFQPLVDPDPSMTKEWMDLEMAFEGVGTTMSLTPTFDATSYTAVSLAASTIESRLIVPVPRNAPALSARLAPGFTFATGETTNTWSLRMMAVTYEVAMTESMMR
jgi:hypothetical protein